MTTPQGYRAIDVPADRIEDFLEIDAWAFAAAWEPADLPHYVEQVPAERARALVVDDAALGSVGELVAVHSSYEMRLAVPGGRVRAAGLTWVGVHPAHRRRGLLTSMIAEHFERSLARGEAVSILYAAETEIYTRFGYGLGSRALRGALSSGVKLRDVPGSEALTVRIERASAERHGAIVAALNEASTRPGSIAPQGKAAVEGRFPDPAGERRGREPLGLVIVEDKGEPVAYAFFRRQGTWDEASNPSGKCEVGESVALTAAASHRLWTVLTSFDLITTTTFGGIASDDPLLLLAANPRALRPVSLDNLWVRVLDVKAALEARRYVLDTDVVFELADEQVPANAGRWRLRVVDGRATVTRTEDAADLAWDAQQLGAAYLGGESVEALAVATLVRERTPGAARELGLAMRSPVAPFCQLHF